MSYLSRWLACGTGIAIAIHLAQAASPILAESRLPLSELTSVSPAHLLDEAVPIYLDASNGAATKIYIAPYVLPNYDQAEKDLEQQCTTPSSDTKTIHIDIELSSPIVDKAVLDQVKRVLAMMDTQKKVYPTFVDTTTVHGYPWTKITVGTYSPTPNSENNVFKKRASIQAADVPNAVVNDTLPRRHLTFDLNEKCGELRRIIKNGAFYGQLETPAYLVSYTTAIASVGAFFNSVQWNDLIHAESSSGGIVTSLNGSSATLGLNFGDVFGSGNVSNEQAMTSDTRHRAISSNLVRNALESYVQFLRGTALSFGVAGETPQKREEMAAKALEKLSKDVLSQFKEAQTVQFKPNEDKSYLIKADNVTGRLTPADIDLLVKSSSKPELHAQRKDSANILKIGEFKSEKDATNKEDYSIELQQKSNKDWVPTDAKLLIVSEADVRSAVTASYTTVGAVPTDSAPLGLLSVPSTHLPSFFEQEVAAARQKGFDQALEDCDKIPEKPSGRWQYFMTSDHQDLINKLNAAHPDPATVTIRVSTNGDNSNVHVWYNDYPTSAHYSGPLFVNYAVAEQNPVEQTSDFYKAISTNVPMGWETHSNFWYIPVENAPKRMSCHQVLRERDQR